MKITNNELANIALLSALSVVFGYVEYLVPVFIPVPGIKLGISNIVLIFCLYKFDIKLTWIIMLIKVIVSSLLFSGFQTFLYALAGGILSVLAMSVLKKSGKFSILFVSIAGAIAHNIGQLFTAAAILRYISIRYYMPILVIAGMLTGLLTGIITRQVLRKY